MQSDDFPSLPGPKSFGACETSHGNDEWVHPFNGETSIYMAMGQYLQQFGGYSQDLKHRTLWHNLPGLENLFVNCGSVGYSHHFTSINPQGFWCFVLQGILQYLQLLFGGWQSINPNISQRFWGFFMFFLGKKRWIDPSLSTRIYQIRVKDTAGSWGQRISYQAKGPREGFFCFPTRVNLSTADGAGNSTHDCWIMLPSGKRLHHELEDHHFLAGKIHYVYGHFQ